MNIGHKRWVIADGYIPPDSSGTSRELVSHDAMCILNCNAQNAHVEVTLYFSDRDPVGPYCFSVKALRTQQSVSMNSQIRNPFRTIPIMPASLNRMCLLSYNIRGSIPASRRSR